MSKKSNSKTFTRKPVKVRVDLTMPEIAILIKVLAHINDESPFDDEWLERLANIEEKIVNAPLAGSLRRQS